MKSKKIYCVYCGEKNKEKDLKCKKCNKKLNPKENMFLDYLKDKIKGDLKGKTEDKVFDIIKNFIISHLYGTIFTATLIFTTLSAIITNMDDNVIKVFEKPNSLLSSLNKCVFVGALSPIDLCDEGYVLEEGICKKEEEVSAKESIVCPNGFFYNGTSCISNMDYEKVIDKQCLLPNDGAYEVYIGPNGECVANYCANWSDTGECTAGSGEPIDFTITEYCPNGTTMVGGVCKSITNSILEYSCEQGTLNNNKCFITREKESHIGCLEGYTYNEECNLCVLGE